MEKVLSIDGEYINPREYTRELIKSLNTKDRERYYMKEGDHVSRNVKLYEIREGLRFFPFFGRCIAIVQGLNFNGEKRLNVYLLDHSRFKKRKLKEVLESLVIL